MPESITQAEPCSFVECTFFQPDEMVARVLTRVDVDDVYWYCPDHDPLEDGSAMLYFEEADTRE